MSVAVADTCIIDDFPYNLANLKKGPLDTTKCMLDRGTNRIIFCRSHQRPQG